MKEDCCQDHANLSEPEQLSDDLALQICGVCGAKHYLLTLDTADLVGQGTDA